MIHRKSKIPDFPIIIDRLNKSGISMAEISEFTGCKVTTLSRTRSEAREIPPSWLQAYYLLDMYTRTFDTPIPFYGEHNE